MHTDRLISALAADNDTRAMPTGWVLAFALAIAAPVSVAIFMMRFGVRTDFMVALPTMFFELKFVITIALALVAATLVLRLARPGARLTAAWWLAVPAGVLALGVAADLMLPQPSSWSTRMMGSNSTVCLTAIPLLSLPMLIASLAGLRHGAATHPALAGAGAGLLSGAIAATLYAAHCFDDSPLFVAVWYSAAIALVTAIGAIVGARVLRF